MRASILTLPNQVTFLRLALLPVYFILIFYGHYPSALGVLLVAGLSDALDGQLARRLNQKSELGAFLDPIADKLLLSGSYLILAFNQRIAWWLTILVLARDVIIMIIAAVILLVVGYRTFPPTIYGKVTTIVQILLVVAVLAGAAFDYPSHQRVSGLLVYLTAAFTVFSGLHYSFLIARSGGTA
jgi:cardiolipin synthase (CMP-forming)